MKRDIFACILLLVFFIICSAPQYAQNLAWPQFRGINCSGIAAENQDPPTSFAKDQNMIWNTSLSVGQSSPCIWNDNIFITGFEEEEKKLQMYCIDRSNGAINWLKEISVDEFEKVHAVSSPANATPATDGERVVFYFSSYGLLCYDNEGNMLWELPMKVPQSQHGMGTSPVIHEDLVILNCFGHVNDPHLLAINKYDGKIVWKQSSTTQEDTPPDSYSSPVVYGDQIIIYRNEDVSGYNIKTGDRIWRFQTGVQDAIGTPVIGDDKLYVIVYSQAGNLDMRNQFPDFIELLSEYDENQDMKISKEEGAGFTFLMDPEKPVQGSMTLAAASGFWDKNNDSLIDSTEWKFLEIFLESFYQKQGIKAIKLGGEGDVTIEHFLWGSTDNVPHVTSPLIYKNRVYMIRSGGILSCFQADKGNLLFYERIGAAGAYFASPVASNGRIYFASRNGIITVIEADSELKILDRNDLDEIIAATPAIVDNKIYIRTEHSLYAFGD